MFLIPMGIIPAQYPEVLATSNLTSIPANLNWIGIWGNLIPVTLGNLVGGMVFVSFLYWFIYIHGRSKVYISPKNVDTSENSVKE